MTTEKSHLSTQAADASTNSIEHQILQSLRTNKNYRHAFVEEKIRTALAIQIKAIREQRGMDNKALAEKLGKKLSWIYRLENPNASPPTITTLLEVAKVFDVDLSVRFRCFSELLSEVHNLSPESFCVASFAEELPELERQSGSAPVSYKARKSPISINSHQDYSSGRISHEQLGGLPDASLRPFPARAEAVRSQNLGEFTFGSATRGRKVNA